MLALITQGKSNIVIAALMYRRGDAGGVGGVLPADLLVEIAAATAGDVEVVPALGSALLGAQQSASALLIFARRCAVA